MIDPIRLAKRVAELRACSRREAELLITGGWVKVDGIVVEEPQFRVADQRIEIDPQADPSQAEPVTLLLHKPPGYHTLQGDNQNGQPASQLLEAANLWAGLLVDEDGHVVLVVRLPGSSEWTWQKDEKPLQPGQWVHYAAVVRYDALTGAILEATLYRDGNDVKGDTTRPPDLTDLTALRCTDGFYIGGLCASAGSYYFAGRIDEIRLWNRALSEKEIDVWRKLPGIVFNEVAYWAFDDGPGHDSGKTCLLGQTCDLSGAGGFHLAVQGPGWVEADAGLVSGAVERP